MTSVIEQRGVYTPTEKPAPQPLEHEINKKVKEALELFDTARNFSFSTVRPNGLPHACALATDFVFMSGAVDLRCYFWSREHSRHAEDVRRMGWAALLLFNSHADVTSLSMLGEVRQMTLEETVAILPEFNARREARKVKVKPQKEFENRRDIKHLYEARIPRVEVPVALYDVADIQAAGEDVSKLAGKDVDGGYVDILPHLVGFDREFVLPKV